MTKIIKVLIAFAAITAPASARLTVQAVDNASAVADLGVDATFGSQRLNLADSWGDARACVEIAGEVSCYRSEAAMDAAHPELGKLASHHVPTESATAVTASTAGVGFVARANCATQLRLYSSTSFGGNLLTLTSRSVVHNLSVYGFDNIASSYKVGACSSTFWSGANASGSTYPGSTGANASASTMGGGWDNTLSSVRIN